MSTIVNNRYAKDIDRFLDYNDIKIIDNALPLQAFNSIKEGLIPENSILIKCKPTVPKIKGNMKLIKFGKNDVILVLKKELKLTSRIAIEIKKIPEYK